MSFSSRTYADGGRSTSLSPSSSVQVLPARMTSRAEQPLEDEVAEPRRLAVVVGHLPDAALEGLQPRARARLRARVMLSAGMRSPSSGSCSSTRTRSASASPLSGVPLLKTRTSLPVQVAG